MYCMVQHQVYAFGCSAGQFWVIFRSPGLSLIGHRVIQVNKCDPVAMLISYHHSWVQYIIKSVRFYPYFGFCYIQFNLYVTEAKAMCQQLAKYLRCVYTLWLEVRIFQIHSYIPMEKLCLCLSKILLSMALVGQKFNSSLLLQYGKKLLI